LPRAILQPHRLGGMIGVSQSSTNEKGVTAMDIPSVSSIQFLVNQISLIWHRQRQLPASCLWWLWLATILIHLFLSVSIATLPGPEGVGEAVVVTRANGCWHPCPTVP
jgi:hypothetical protein